MTGESAATDGTRRQRPLWATLIAVGTVLCGVGFLAMGVREQIIKSGRVLIGVPMPLAVAIFVVTLVVGWFFWAMKGYAGKSLMVVVWLGLLGSLAMFLWVSKPGPEVVMRVSLWLFLPWTLLAVVLTLFLSKKRESFEEWAER